MKPQSMPRRPQRLEPIVDQRCRANDSLMVAAIPEAVAPIPLSDELVVDAFGLYGPDERRYPLAHP